MPVPQKFIDVQAEPFDGCLMIMNINNDNFHSLNMSREFETSLCDAIKQAHAKGHAVLYLGDALHGTGLPPDDFPALDGADVSRLMSQVCGLQIADFPSDPVHRMNYFSDMARIAYENARSGALLPLIFTSSAYSVGNWRIAGSCKIDGVKVLHPVTTISYLRL